MDTPVQFSILLHPQEAKVCGRSGKESLKLVDRSALLQKPSLAACLPGSSTAAQFLQIVPAIR
jgi:hypothetical protein